MDTAQWETAVRAFLAADGVRPPTDNQSILDTVKKGDKLSIEADISDLIQPTQEIGFFGAGPSRTIRVANTKIMEE